MCLAQDEPVDEQRLRKTSADDVASGLDGPASSWSEEEAATLASRISSVQEKETLLQKLESMDHAWVLVFDADSEEEAVYSMEMEGEEGEHVVLAFEDREEAEAYSVSLREEAYSSDASVQALDVEALVVTSRDADFRVGIVFSGDLTSYKAGDGGSDDEFASPFAPLITSGDSDLDGAGKSQQRVSVSITMVPDSCFEGKTASDFLDPSEDPVWVLVHDAGTGDAQYFSMNLNGTDSVVCFKDEEAAERCGAALENKGASAPPIPRSVLLEDLMETLDDTAEVCLVDEVVETILDDEGGDDAEAPYITGVPGVIASDINDEILGSVSRDAGTSAQESSAIPAAVRKMLEGLYEQTADEGSSTSSNESCDDDSEAADSGSA